MIKFKYRVVKMKSGRFAIQEIKILTNLDEKFYQVLTERFDTKEAAQFWIDDHIVVEEYE